MVIGAIGSIFLIFAIRNTPDLKRKLAEHNVTWSRRDSFCKDQYAVKQPEEFPTAPVSTVIRQSSPPPGADSFDHFNFDKEVEW